ncbi:MAG: hypothetical protein NTV37_05055 [Proteobacteria bacterium]|nr:hypothetical protein [Pseudomonadota bacterium]
MPLATFVKAELHRIPQWATRHVDVSLLLAGSRPALPNIGGASILDSDSKAKTVLGHFVRPNVEPRDNTNTQHWACPT